MKALKVELIRRAIKNNPGKLLMFVGDEKNWDDCFTIEKVKGKDILIFWYNLESGATLSETATLTEED